MPPVRCLSRSVPLVLFVLAASVVARPAPADDEELGWKNKAELSFVTTQGNSEGSTLGFGASFERKWTDRRFQLTFGGLRAESSTFERIFVLQDDGTLIFQETETSELTAENYEAATRFDRDFADDWFWHVGLSGKTDEFAGVDSRLSAVAGVGHTFWDDDSGKLRGDVGVTWTSEEPVVGASDDFVGLRVSWDYAKTLSESTTLTHTMVIDQNLDDTDDLRADAGLAVEVAMTKKLALRASLEAEYDAEPALIAVPVLGETFVVLREVDDLDTQVTVALVVNF